jgi:hypothetical protein
MSAQSIRECMALIGKGDCYFKKLTPQELLNYTRELKNSGLKSKSRKVRADLGGQHAPRGRQKLVEVSGSGSESASSGSDNQGTDSDSDDDKSHHSRKGKGKGKGKGKRVTAGDSDLDEPSRKKKKTKESDHGKHRRHVIKERTQRSYSPKRVKVFRA